LDRAPGCGPGECRFDPGRSPQGGFDCRPIHRTRSSVGLERPTTNREGAGSNPAGFARRDLSGFNVNSWGHVLAVQDAALSRRRGSIPRGPAVVVWPSGEAADCKPVHPGSIPGTASGRAPSQLALWYEPALFRDGMGSSISDGSSMAEQRPPNPRCRGFDSFLSRWSPVDYIRREGNGRLSKSGKGIAP
jgi:hypothetical protein